MSAEARRRNPPHEKRTGGHDANWPDYWYAEDWYADYIVRAQAGEPRAA